jgi:hypothetical protein
VSALTKCPKCGNENPASAQFCTKCGNALEAKIRPPANVPLQIPVYPGTFSGRPLDHALARMEPKKRESVNRTRTGLGLILLGIVMEAIPTLSFYGALPLIAGVALVFLGRRAFGAQHQRYVSRSFILVVAGVFAQFVGSFLVGGLIALSLLSGADPATTLSSFFLALNMMLIVIDAIIGLGLVFFTYDLQNATGRTILWAAYSLGVLMNAIFALVIFSQVQAASADVVSQVGTASAAINLLIYAFAPWRLLQLIPAIFYAIAYFRSPSELEKKAVLEPSPASQ